MNCARRKWILSAFVVELQKTTPPAITLVTIIEILLVTVEPIVIPQSKVVVAIEGGQATLVCNVEAWPRPTMTWEKDGEEVFDSTKYALVSEFRSLSFLQLPELYENSTVRFR